MGEVLRSIHAIRTGGFGPLILKDGHLLGKFPDLRLYNKNLYHDSDYVKKYGFLSDTEFKALQEIERELRSAEWAETVFLHADYHPEHIFSDGKKVSGVIDLGNIKSGDPRSDIAYALFFLEDQYSEAFTEGYGPLAKDPFVEKYLISVAAHKIVYRHLNNFSERIPRAVEKLKKYISIAV